MLDRTGFDQWADEYDKTVRLSNEENTYPFSPHLFFIKSPIVPVFYR